MSLVVVHWIQSTPSFKYITCKASIKCWRKRKKMNAATLSTVSRYIEIISHNCSCLFVCNCTERIRTLVCFCFFFLLFCVLHDSVDSYDWAKTIKCAFSLELDGSMDFDWLVHCDLLPQGLPIILPRLVARAFELQSYEPLPSLPPLNFSYIFGS